MKNFSKRVISIILTLVIVVTLFPLSGIELKASAMNSRVEAAVAWAQGIAADNSHGYSQDDREGVPDYDCSSLVYHAFKNAGLIDFDVSKLHYTGTMKNDFTKYGFTWIPASQLGNLRNGDTSKLKRGDILLNESAHTEIYLGNGKNVGASSGTQNSYGYHYRSGYPKEKYGDTTGNEIREKNYWWDNWDGVLRLEYEDYSLETPCDKIMEANESTVIVREGPAKTYSEKDKIPKGTEVNAVSYFVNQYGHIWYRVEYNGKSGWIYSVRLKELSKYKVTYNLMGGKDGPSAQTKKKNQTIKISSTYPTKTNCQFVGWSTNSKISSIYKDSDSAVKQVEYAPGASYSDNSSLKLYAVWLETKTTISLSTTKVDLCLDDNTTSTINISISGVVDSGYKIGVSSVNNVNTTSSKISVSKIAKLRSIAHITDNKGTASIKLTAKEKGKSNLYVYVTNTSGKQVAASVISVNVTKKYYITYNANGGTGAPAKQVKISGKNQCLSSNAPIRSGYFFMGWATPSSNGAAVYGPGDIYNIESDITLTAVWSPEYKITAEMDASDTVLTITGHGDMPCYGENTYQNSVWHQFANKAKTIVFVASDGGAITSIGSYAFAGFNELTKIEIPTTVSRIHSYAFYNCGSLRSVSVPTNAVVGSYAFANCGKLSNYTKSSSKKSSAAKVSALSVTEDTGSIGAFAFENCVNLQSIDVSDASTIGESVFSGCTSLSDITLSDELNIIEDCAFYNCSNLSDLSIPETISEISDGAFSGCASLESIDLPESIDTIGDQAFSGCSSIESIEIPDSVENIGSSTFANCSSLKNVELPEDTFSLSDSMFSGCTSLQSIDVPDSVLNLGDGTFLGCTGLKDIEIPTSVCEIGNNTFAYCKSLTDINIPDSVSNISDFAFFGCSGLKNIEFSSNLNSIGSCAFCQCTSLESINLPGTLSSIEEAAFSECTALKNVDFEESMVSIADNSFAGCTSLETVNVPECASYVSNTAFSDCSNSLKVSCYSTSDVYTQISESGVSYNTIYPVEGLTITTESTTLKKDETLKLNTEFTPSNATNKKITWFSENEDVATVDNNGVITAVGSGTATIVATTQEGNYEAIYEVNCTIPVKSITVVNTDVDYFVGTEFCITCSINPENPTNFDLVYKSSNESVATVDSDGLLTIVGKGTAIIDVNSADGNAKTSFTINAEEYIPVSSIQLSDEHLELYVGNTAKLSSTVIPSNATYSNVYYYSENENIAKVDENGNVEALKEGITTIVCVSDSAESSCQVEVKVPQNKVKSVDISDVSINYKSSTVITPIIDADNDTSYTVKYESSNSNVATVNNNGEVTTWGTGDTTITCTVTDQYGNIASDKCTVSVSYAWWQWIINILLFGWIWY